MAQEIDKIIKSTTPPKSKDVLWDNGKELLINRNGKWESTGGGTPMINITYANLVELRNNSKLIAGMQYRITDYVTTTAQKNTISAGHRFDIIVTADNENTLNEVAKACKSEFNIKKYKDAYSQTWSERMTYLGTYEYYGKIYHRYESESQDMQMLVDFREEVEELVGAEHYLYRILPSYINVENNGWLSEYSDDIVFTHNPAEASYFNGSNLAAWQIWYSLDNDVERFAWADAENGKGVIYRMIDEWNNDVPYDFKNILFMDMNRYKISAEANYYGSWWAGELVRDSLYDVQTAGPSYYAWVLDNVSGPGSSGVWYTNSDRAPSIDAIFYEYDGSEFYVSETIRITNIEFGLMQYTFGNTLSPDKALSKFVDYTMTTPTSGNLCSNNIINAVITDKQELNFILFGGFSSYNTFGSNCYNNIFGGNCRNNSFGNGCYSNSFGGGFRSNTFGNDCYYNRFKNSCDNNIFGNDCCYNNFAENCTGNIFYNGCSDISFGTECRYNSFGDMCQNVKLSNNTYYKTVSVNSNNEVKIFNLADLADLLNS